MPTHVEGALPRVGFRLYLITDRRLMKPSPAEALDRALSAIPPGSAAVQLRERDLSATELLALGRSLAPACQAHRAPLLINDRLDIARILGAGVHLARASVTVPDARAFLGPEALIGASCHSRAEVAEAAAADFVTLGPVFDTPSKRSYGPPLGLDGVRQALEGGAPPAFALGGINLATGPLALGQGMHGLAVIRAAWEGNPASQSARLWSILSR